MGEICACSDLFHNANPYGDKPLALARLHNMEPELAKVLAELGATE